MRIARGISGFQDLRISGFQDFRICGAHGLRMYSGNPEISNPEILKS
jgi:hypothetical protein